MHAKFLKVKNHTHIQLATQQGIHVLNFIHMFSTYHHRFTLRGITSLAVIQDKRSINSPSADHRPTDCVQSRREKASRNRPLTHTGEKGQTSFTQGRTASHDRPLTYTGGEQASSSGWLSCLLPCCERPCCASIIRSAVCSCSCSRSSNCRQTRIEHH